MRLENLLWRRRHIPLHLWTWLSWRENSKLPNEHPLDHCVKQWAIIGRFPCFPLQRGLTVCRTCAAIQHTVAVPGLGFKFHVSRSGVRIPVKMTFFGFFPSPNFLQRSINGEYFLNNSIDWLIWVVIRVTSQKNALTGIRTPDLESWNLKWNWNCHSVLNCSTGSTRSQTSLWRKTRKVPYDYPLLHSFPMGVH